MAVSVNQVATPAEIVAIDTAQAPGVALLRGDQSSLPPAALLARDHARVAARRPAHQRQAADGPVHRHAQPRPARLGDRGVHGHRCDRRRLPALIRADHRRRPPAHAHRLARRGQRRLPAPAQPGHPLLHAARETAEDPGHADRGRGDAQHLARGRQLTRARLAAQRRPDLGPSGNPQATGWQRAPGGATLSFTAGYGQWAANPDANPVITEPLSGQVTLSAPAAGRRPPSPRSRPGRSTARTTPTWARSCRPR